MKILYAAPEKAWGGFLDLIRAELPQFQFDPTGHFGIPTLRGYDVLIPTMCPVTKADLNSADRLRLIQQCGSGLEGVDHEAARKRNIWVANVPTGVSGNADSVAELGIFMMIGLARNLHGLAGSLANRKMGEPQGKALSGRTVGLIGLGGIGRALISRLRPFDVRIIGLKRRAPAQARQALQLEWVGSPSDMPVLLQRSDFVMLCLPLTPATRDMINAEALGAMQPSAYLINLSRGGLVNRDALEAALSAGTIAGAGLDVFWEEPPDPDDPIFKYNVIATPHIAGSTDVSMRGIVRGVAENLRRIARNQEPRNHL
jgi:phosphoglycerate dehydrogenase-like enzyme